MTFPVPLPTLETSRRWIPTLLSLDGLQEKSRGLALVFIGLPPRFDPTTGQTRTFSVFVLSGPQSLQQRTRQAMSGVEFVSAVVGLIDVGAKVVHLCSTYIRGVVDAKTSASQLLSEVSVLQACLGEIIAFSSSVEQGSPGEARLIQLETPLKECEGRLSDVSRRLEMSLGSNKRTSKMSTMQRMVWPFKEKELKDLVSLLCRFRGTIADIVTVEIGYSTRRIETTLKENDLITGEIRDTARSIETTLAEHNRSELIQSLSPLEPEKRHQDVRSRRLEGTVSWLLQSEQFMCWRSLSSNDTPTVLCYTGGPGVGKTFVSSAVIDDLRHFIKDVGNVVVVFFYSDYRDQALQTAAHILGSLLSQMAKKSSKLPEELSSLYEAKKGSSCLLDVQQAEQFLVALCKQLTRTYCCIDALDELANGTRVQLLRSLQLLCHECPGFRMCFTNRPSVKKQIFESLGRSITVHHSPIMASDQDVRRYVMEKINADPDKASMNESLRCSIVNTLVDLSHGMFLLPALHLDTILNEETIRERRLKLRELPRDLFGTFEEALERIRAQRGGRSRRAMDALMWVFLAEKPLTVEELRYALATVPGVTRLNIEEDLPPPLTFLENTSGLLVADEETQTVRLVHHSLQEYFSAKQSIVFPDGHAVLALATLTYLTFDANATDYGRGGIYHCFAEYAANNWGHHARRQSNGPVVESARCLLLNGEHFARLDLIRKAATYTPWRLTYEHDVLHEVACFGAVAIMSEMLACLPHQADAKDTRGDTPISWAAAHGHDRVLRLLLDRDDVDAESKNVMGETPLWRAAEAGHEAVVRLLLERDSVDPNWDTRGYFNGSPLSEAASRGHAGVVQELLKRKDTDPDFRDGRGRTPLSRAAERGHEEIVQLLLERESVDVDARDDRGWTPLSYAAESGHETIVQRLLEREDVFADLNSNFDRTPLSLAAENGREAVVRLLLERAEVRADSTDWCRHTPLWYAVREGHDAVVELLLERDDVDPAPYNNPPPDHRWVFFHSNNRRRR